MIVSFRQPLTQTLRLFLWARAQHLLRQGDGPAGFSAAVDLIRSETGLDAPKIRAAVAGGFSSAATQERLARWCGLKRVTKHNQPVLVTDPDADFDRGPGGGVTQISPEEALRRVSVRQNLEDVAV
ncbi:hypothetical protein [Roseibium sp.]|uniref:hypothetical protein n=1 Tax=Roseibium sp. TaxID=1936156 RepID=UPI0032967FE6